MDNIEEKSCRHFFGERLRQLRNEKGLSQEALAKVLGISKGSLGFYETCKNTPDIEILNTVSVYFDVSFDYLLGKTSFKAADADLLAIGNSLGISEKAAENMRIAAYGYWKPLNFVLENEGFWKLLKIMETYGIACRNDDNTGQYLNNRVLSAAEAFLPDPQQNDLIEFKDAFYQTVFSRCVMQIAEDYNKECSKKDGSPSGKHKQEYENLKKVRENNG